MPAVQQMQRLHSGGTPGVTGPMSAFRRLPSAMHIHRLPVAQRSVKVSGSGTAGTPSPHTPPPTTGARVQMPSNQSRSDVEALFYAGFAAQLQRASNAVRALCDGTTPPWLSSSLPPFSPSSVASSQS